MSEVAVLTKREIEKIIHDASAVGFKKGAEWFKKEIESKEENDIISKEEAMQILNCKSTKLGKLRTDRKIKFSRIGNEYKYSRENCVKYVIDNMINAS